MQSSSHQKRASAAVLWVAFALLIVILAGIGFAGLERMGKIAASLRRLNDNELTNLDLSREAVKCSSVNSRITMQIFLMTDRAEIDKLLAQRVANTAKIGEIITQLDRHVDTPQERELLDAVKAARNPYIESYQQAIGILLHDGNYEAGRRMMVEKTIPNLARYHEAWEKFVQYESSEADRVIRESNELDASVRMEFLQLIAAAVLGAIAIAVFSTRQIIRQINERLKAEEALHESMQRYTFLADAMPQIVWTSKPDGSIDYYNQRWFDYTGFTLEQAKDWGWKPVLHPDDLQNCIERWTHSFTTGAPYEIEYRFKRASDGAYRWHLGRALPLKNEKGDTIAWFGTCTDIDDQKRLEAQISKARDELNLRVQERTSQLEKANEALRGEILERTQAEGMLQREQGFLRILLESLDAGILACDAEGRLTVANHAIRRFHSGSDESGTPQEWVQRVKSNLHYADGRAMPLEESPLFRVLRGEVVRGQEVVIAAPDGVQRTVLASGQAIVNVLGKKLGAVLVLHDITERKRAEAELQEAKEIAEDASRSKSEFLANMSHEIRTPMNGIIGLTGLLMSTAMDQQQGEYVRTINHSADALLTIINDILDFSKIEARKLTLEPINFDLLSTVESAVEVEARNAHDKGVELADFVDPDVPFSLRGDAGRLRQVLTNLVSNAVKFTASGEVSVFVSKESATPGDIVVRFEVKDTGIGIPREAQPRLFRAFSQADGSTTRKYGGTGLGLAISKELVALMGGEIGVVSTPGSGSTFWFTACFGKVTENAVGDGPPQSYDLTGLRALIVDDNATNRHILHHHLSAWNMDADWAACAAADALALLRKEAAHNPYKLVVLDMQMPEMDGLMLARAIKGDPAIAGAHLVMLTSLGQLLNAEEMKQTGIEACMVKPVKQSRLFDCLAGVLFGTSTRSGGAAPVPAPPQVTVQPCEARVLLAEDNPVNQMVALGQLKKLGYAADAVTNGVEALSALKKKSYDIILMDCQMPEMDGYEATQQIRARGDDVPQPYIIAMTANAMKGDSEKCFEAGMNDYISKPVKLDAFAAALARGLAASASTHPPVENGVNQKEAGQIGDSNESAMCAETMRNLKELSSAMGPAYFSELLETFERDAARSIAALRQAFAERNTVRLREKAHALKGASHNMGVPSMANLCRDLENLGLASSIEDAGELITSLERAFERVRSEIKHGSLL